MRYEYVYDCTDVTCHCALNMCHIAVSNAILPIMMGWLC